MYEVVLNANKLAIKNIKANMIGSEVDSISRNYIKEN
jgi:Xaa-Pro aminopeptidase